MGNKLDFFNGRAYVIFRNDYMRWFFLLEAVQLVSSSELGFYDALSHFAMGIIFAVENSFIPDASATEFLVITYIKIEQSLAPSAKRNV